MQRSNSTDTSSIDSDIYASMGFAGDQATAHAHRAAKLISEYLKLTQVAKTRLQEFIKKMLYYKTYKFDDLCTAVVLVQKLARVPRFVDFSEDMGLAIDPGAGIFDNGVNAQDVPQLIFAGAYSLAESLNSTTAATNGVCPTDDISKLALDTRTFTRQEIHTMTEELRGWFDWKLEISSKDWNSVKATLKVN